MATLFGHDRGASPAKLQQLSDTAEKVTRTFAARYVLAGPFSNAPLGATVSLRFPCDLVQDRPARRQGTLNPSCAGATCHWVLQTREAFQRER
ncbi:MAG: hypothetical protein M3Y65_12850 [Pseudomonadota bacterium]|nr:hypothetical protein [Pseudomonadota bacterium]